MSRSGLAQLGLATFCSEKQQLEWVFCSKKVLENDHVTCFFYFLGFKLWESPKELFVLFFKSLVSQTTKGKTQKGAFETRPQGRRVTQPFKRPAFFCKNFRLPSMSSLDISSNKFESLKAPWKEMATWMGKMLGPSDPWIIGGSESHWSKITNQLTGAGFLQWHMI